jgi:hypothetical protein
VALLAGLLVGVASVGAAGPASASGRASAQPLRWMVVPSANQGFGGLGSVSCLSATDCFAAGSHAGGGRVSSTLIERWNGHGFSIVPSPSPSPFNNELDGISCVSAAFCVSVGSADTNLKTLTLIESWNGSRWSVVPSPSPGGVTGIDVLSDVSCVSAAFCIAVGSYGPVNLNNSLIESWNGSRWSVMPSPRGSGSGAVLNAVTCLAVTDCMAVGNYFTPAGQDRTLAATWNGTTWAVVPTPNRGPVGNVNDFNSLGGVFCLPATDCAAVGSWSTAQAVQKTLVESWNGARWTVVPSPNRDAASAANGGLGAIACVSAGDCTATGSFGSVPGGPTKTLIESWNGARWTVVPSPNEGPASDFDSLGGISCPTASFCITVGRYENINAQGHTLAEIGAPA